MKKATMFLSAVLCTSAFFGQSVFEALPGNDFLAVPPSQSSSLVDCSFENLGPTDSYYSPITNYMWADDVIVSAGESMTVTSIMLEIATEAGSEIEEIDVKFFTDSDGYGPDELISAQLYVEPTSQEIIASGTIGSIPMDIRQVVLTVDPVLFEGSATEESVYWIGFQVEGGGTTPRLSATNNVIGDQLHLFIEDEDGDFWAPANEMFAEPIPPPRDWVMSVYGDCTTLGVDSNVLSNVSIYPNPTTDILNIQTPSNVTVQSVAMFDLLGKKVNVSFVNGTIKTSALAKGVYLLQVNTDQGTLTQKIVKQ